MVVLKKPWLLVSAEAAHRWAPCLLPIVARWPSSIDPKWRSLEWRGLHFRNRLGLAGGVDKDAVNVEDWWKLGVGFIEIGTVTPVEQKSNPGKVVARNLKLRALWNKLGFPSEGAEKVLRRLNELRKPYRTPLFVNVGKNRTTPNEEAVEDYLDVIGTFEDAADAFVINLSSPNTVGLRDLLKPESLQPLLSELRLKTKKPCLLKLSPDTEDGDLLIAIDTAIHSGMNGFILTNTTLERSPEMTFSHEGGVSGQPLAPRSKSVLQKVVSHLGPRRKDFLVISVGGVMSPEDVEERLQLGADLVQIYTALIFEGPLFFRHVARKIGGAR